MFRTRTNHTEATLQAELYGELKKAGLHSHLEESYILPDGQTTRTGRKRKIRVDVTVCGPSGEILAFIETKPTPGTKHSMPVTDTRQYKKYVSMGIPFRYCTSMEAIPETVAWARAFGRWEKLQTN